MLRASLNEQALKIVNKAATRLGLNIEVVREEGTYFKLKGMEDYTFHPAALKQFVKAVKRDECSVKASPQTEVLIKMLQWYVKETGCHMYGISAHGNNVYTAWLGKDRLRVTTNKDGNVIIRSINLDLEMPVETISDELISSLMGIYADKIRTKAFNEALLPEY